HNIGKEIISYLFNRNSNTGEMSTERIHSRGLYNVSDQNILESQATKRGIEGLKDQGFSLIRNCHLMILDYANIRYEYKKGDDNGDFYWYSTPAAYLFKIEWNEQLQNELFDCWIDESTPVTERKNKKIAFEKLSVPMKFIIRVTDDSRSENTGIEEQQRKVNNGGKRKYRNEDLKENAFNKMIFLAADYLRERIEGKYESFQIQNSIYAIHPIRSKIGKKEGIKVNDRYFVYEHIAKNDKSTKLARRGVVKATTHIANNRQIATGDSPTTEFYQIAGGKLEEGMTLKEKQSYYINLDLGYRYGELEGIYAGINTSLYATRATNHYIMLQVTGWEKAVTASIDYGFGLRCNNFEIYPYIGAGLDSFLKDKDESEADDKEGKNNAWLAQGGVRFNLNIYYPVQLFGAVEYNYPFSEGEKYKEKKITKDRDIEGFNLCGGIRICF
ncbi:MAG: hypothetical protein LUH01_06135, partial [Parabacteroides gordonii]|nr:hypothetical protein [Parabacteroides gordonii]